VIDEFLGGFDGSVAPIRVEEKKRERTRTKFFMTIFGTPV
jgi:hypothetical protein